MGGATHDVDSTWAETCPNKLHLTTSSDTLSLTHSRCRPTYLTMQVDWLRRYATGYHQWRQARDNNADIFYRPLGMVESGFDADGVYHEGRADITMALHLEIKTTMSDPSLRRHIALAWACLRLRHALLCAVATSTQAAFMDADAGTQNPRFFVVRRPVDHAAAVQAAKDCVSFLGDFYASVDPGELYVHAQNTARTFDAENTLARLFVLPWEKTSSANSYPLRFLFTMAHQISDGLTNWAWADDFIQLLNQKSGDLHKSISPLIQTLHERLPLPQEDLYRPISGSVARQRWFWAVTLVLRHVQKPLPAAFPNPLRFSQGPIAPAVPEPRRFGQVLDYTKPPTLNAGTVQAHIGPDGTRRLHRVCRQVGCSIGAGCFVLVAIVMMELHEKRFPHLAGGKTQRRPFIGSFPLNPRPFFNHTAQPDSLMLAFSDGIVLPFLPSDLDLDGRIKLLVRSAQRQLSRYQKRPPKVGGASVVNTMIQHMGPRGAGRVVPMNFLDIIARTNDRLPKQLKMDLPYQTTLPAQANPTMATCGVSSVGKSSPSLQSGRYDLDRPLDGDDVVADIKGVRMNVRPRDGEFLVGVWGNDDSISVNVSYDACAIDPVWAEIFRKRIEKVLGEVSVTARL